MPPTSFHQHVNSGLKIKNKPRTVRPRGSRIVSYSIAFGRPGLSSRVCAHARTASSE